MLARPQLTKRRTKKTRKIKKLRGNKEKKRHARDVREGYKATGGRTTVSQVVGEGHISPYVGKKEATHKGTGTQKGHKRFKGIRCKRLQPLRFRGGSNMRGGRGAKPERRQR